MNKTLDMLSPVDMVEARGNVYGFLSRFLLEPPSEKLMSPLREPDMLSNLASIFGESNLTHLQEFINHFPGSLETLIQEYNDLFVVPLGSYVMPYEAVYRDEREVEGKRIKGLLIGESTAVVQKSYQQAGLAISDAFLDLPDHAGIELSFMSFLCSKQAAALKQSDGKQSLEYLEMQKAFLNEHLISWMPKLCARITENADGPFYKGLAKLIHAFLTLEAETLNQPRLS